MPYDTMRQALAWWDATTPTPPTPVAGQTITSAWLQVALYPIPTTAQTIPVYHDRRRLTAVCYTDQASVANGLIIQQSNDEGAVKAVHYQTAASVPAGGDGLALDDPILCKYVRVSYTQGPVNPAVFSLRVTVRDQ